MAELADAPDLGSGGRPCRFKSCYPQSIAAKYLVKARDLAFSLGYTATNVCFCFIEGKVRL